MNNQSIITPMSAKDIEIVRESKLWFTNFKVAVGDKIFWYENKGKEELIGYQDVYGSFVTKDNYMKHSEDKRSNMIRLYTMLGKGRVVLSSVVEEVWDNKINGSTIEHYCNNEYVGGSHIGLMNGMNYKGQKRTIKLKDFREEDLDVKDFVSWSKLIKLGEKGCTVDKCKYGLDKLNGGVTGDDYDCYADINSPCIKLQRPPTRTTRVLIERRKE